VLVEEKANCHETRRDLDRLLHDRFQLTHTTLQVEHCRPSLVELQSGRLRRRGDAESG
jgi:cobalt-zinc-cadmium efflux system protein